MGNRKFKFFEYKQMILKTVITCTHYGCASQSSTVSLSSLLTANAGRKAAVASRVNWRCIGRRNHLAQAVSFVASIQVGM